MKTVFWTGTASLVDFQLMSKFQMCNLNEGPATLRVKQDMKRVIRHYQSMQEVNKLRKSVVSSLIELTDLCRNCRV